MKQDRCNTNCIVIPIKEFNHQAEFKEEPVIELTEESDLELLPKVFETLLLQKRFPLTKGVPFCKGNIKNCTELYKKEIVNSDCDCIFSKFCKPNKFKPEPIKDKEKYVDVLRFLESENSIGWI